MNVQRRKEGKKNHEFNALADAMELLSYCSTIILCPGWENSTGCRAEKAFAMEQGIEVKYLDELMEAP